MIQDFPKFTTIKIGHMELVQDFSKGFLPYSDFNFTSLYSWSINNDTQLSILDDNLVIKLPEYSTGKATYSIFGEKNVDGSVRLLLSKFGKLELVPEIVIDNIVDRGGISINEDRDSFDYVYSVANMAAMKGGGYKTKRKLIGRFNSEFPQAKIHKINDAKYNPEIIKYLLKQWMAERKDDINKSSEYKAILKLIRSYKDLPVYGFILTANDLPIGFSVLEDINPTYSVCHFQKTLRRYPNSDPFFSKEIAMFLDKKDVKYLNWEQDLGFEGMRTMKLSYKPESFLKKFTITDAY